MFRPTASRSLFRSLNAASHQSIRAQIPAARPQLRSQLCTLSKRPQSLAMTNPTALQMIRQATDNRGPMDTIDTKRESRIGEKKLQADPSTVSTTSSTHPIMGEARSEESGERDADMMAGVKHDMVRKEPKDKEGEKIC